MKKYLFIMLFLTGCTNSAVKHDTDNCESSNTIPSSIIKLEYDTKNSMSGDAHTNSVSIEVPAQYQGMPISTLDLRASSGVLVVPLWIIHDKDKSKISSVIFADEKWLDGSFCILVTYHDEIKDTALEVHPVWAYKRIILPPNQ